MAVRRGRSPTPGIDVTDVADITGFPAILGHRVVTLHPKVHGAILADRDDPEHQSDLDEYGIDTIDLVVGNLYPFSADPSIELIDIGGPTPRPCCGQEPRPCGCGGRARRLRGGLGRAPRSGVALGCDPTSPGARRRSPTQLPTTPRSSGGSTSRRADPTDDGLPRSIHLALDRAQDLRYGENPHQVGARYRTTGEQSWWDGATQHGGKDLSYLNLYDTEARLATGKRTQR